MGLIGHREQQGAFIAAASGGRLHHAWLLAGPAGIGKGRFAREAAAWLLARAAGPEAGTAADRFGVDPEHRIARLIGSGAHPDLRLLERVEADSGKLRAEIVIDQVRELQPLFQTTPGLSPWRAVIVDAVDDLNRAAANALLKNLEEPPSNTLFLLVSHSPGRLLATIRSRCRTLRFQPLPPDDVAEVLATQLGAGDSPEREALVRFAEGSPGRALRFAGLGIDELQRDLDALALGAGPDRISDLARQLAGKAAQPRFEAFLELAPAAIAAAAQRRTGAARAQALAAWDEASRLAAEALPLSLEPQAVAYRLASLVAEAGRALRA
ncbi:MAG: DNA polymerase III subunit delta' [Alphaproteobacteria bacterium]|nr:DNA polymerase III subunit delta' [Alphaproteobacteria bacterium]